MTKETRTAATLFTGGGGFDLGMRAAGLTPLWGVESAPDIADVAEDNGLYILRRDITGMDTADFATLPAIDVLHASPPCQSYSVANPNKGENRQDVHLAQAVVRAIDAHKPDLFTLENVRGYRNSYAFRLILRSLMDIGYDFREDVLNTADYGVPQTRKRLFLVARRGQRPRFPFATHARKPPEQDMLFGPPLLPWRGWYSTIEDLIPFLPDSSFAQWQARILAKDPQFAPLFEWGGEAVGWRLRRKIPADAVVFLVRSSNTGQEWSRGFREASEPSFTVTTGPYPPRAFVVEGTGAGNGWAPVRLAIEPISTIKAGHAHGSFRAFVVDCQYNGTPGGERGLTIRQADEPIYTLTSGTTHVARAAVQGRVVKFTAPALARLQTFPDSYRLPEGGLAYTIIGNAVPPLVAQRIIEANI